MKAKYLLPLTAAAMFSLTACDISADSDDSAESSSSYEAPESSATNYTYTSRINEVEKTATTYCEARAENAGLNGYVDASISGFGTIAVTVTQTTGNMETILEIALDDIDDATIQSACDALTDADADYSSCDLKNKQIVSITNQKTDHTMNNTTMTSAMKKLCDVYTAYEIPVEAMIPEDVTYGYKYLTYCEYYAPANAGEEAFFDCEDLPVKKVDAATVSIKNIDDVHFTVAAYFGDEDDKGIIEDTYTLVGFDEDSLGSYWEFTGEEDVVRIYGGDFAVMRAKDESYYYSWSMFDDIYKKIARKFKAIKK